MTKLRAHNLSVSFDGFLAGPDQSQDEPLGVRGEELHGWIFATRWGQEMIGNDPSGVAPRADDRFVERWDGDFGATIMGRNMFGPIRGEWGDSDWAGWWGPNPPYHHPTFVLTHHAHDPIEMEGGTTFHFVTEGPEAALEQAVAAAGGKDVRLGGGASTVRQYLRLGLIDELNLAVVPILLGGGERPLDDLGDAAALYEIAETVTTDAVTHVRLVRR